MDQSSSQNQEGVGDPVQEGVSGITPGRIMGAQLLTSLSSNDNIREELSDPTVLTPHKPHHGYPYPVAESVDLPQQGRSSSRSKQQQASSRRKPKSTEEPASFPDSKEDDALIEGCNCRKSRCLKL